MSPQKSNPPETERFFDMAISGPGVQRSDGGVITVGNCELNRMPRVLEAEAYKIEEKDDDKLKITFFDANPGKIAAFIAKRRAEIESEFGIYNPPKEWIDKKMEGIFTIRIFTRNSTDKAIRKEVLNPTCDIYIGGHYLKERKRLGLLERFAQDLAERLGSKSRPDWCRNGFIIQGAYANLIPEVKSYLEGHCFLKLGQKKDLQLKITDNPEFIQGNPDEGRKPTRLIKCQKSGKTWRMFQ